MTQLQNDRNAYSRAPPRTRRTRTRLCRLPGCTHIQREDRAGPRARVHLAQALSGFQGLERQGLPATCALERRPLTSLRPHAPKARAGTQGCLWKAPHAQPQSSYGPGKSQAQASYLKQSSDSLGRTSPAPHGDPRPKAEGGASAWSNGALLWASSPQVCEEALRAAGMPHP